jgi:DNA-binding MarR family transcriptional regulator
LYLQLFDTIGAVEDLSDDEDRAVARLQAVLELLPSALDRELATTGLTAFELRVLSALHGADLGRLRLSALAARTHATLPRLSRVVTGLETAGFVTRVACEEDGRATNALLTDAGVRVYQESRPRQIEGARRLILDGLDGPGVERLSAALEGLLGNLDPPRRAS